MIKRYTIHTIWECFPDSEMELTDRKGVIMSQLQGPRMHVKEYPG